MEESNKLLPPSLNSILARTEKLDFNMASEPIVGCLLRTLSASKPRSRFLELGTGTGLSASWILDGMCKESSLVTVDNDPKLLEVAREFLGSDKRIEIVCEDGDRFIKNASSSNERFDFIFADTWSGKYRMLEETLQMLNPCGLYIIDDMLAQPNWPADHPPKVKSLLNHLDQRSDFYITKMAWSCGVVICTKKPNKLR